MQRPCWPAPRAPSRPKSHSSGHRQPGAIPGHHCSCIARTPPQHALADSRRTAPLDQITLGGEAANTQHPAAHCPAQPTPPGAPHQHMPLLAPAAIRSHEAIKTERESLAAAATGAEAGPADGSSSPARPPVPGMTRPTRRSKCAAPLTRGTPSGRTPGPVPLPPLLPPALLRSRTPAITTSQAPPGLLCAQGRQLAQSPGRYACRAQPRRPQRGHCPRLTCPQPRADQLASPLAKHRANAHTSQMHVNTLGERCQGRAGAGAQPRAASQHRPAATAPLQARLPLQPPSLSPQPFS